MSELDISIDSIFTLGLNTTMAGEIESGNLVVGQRVEIHSPNGHISAKIKGIEIDRKIVSAAKENDIVALLFNSIDLSAIADGVNKDIETGAITAKSLVIRESSNSWWKFWQ